MDNSVTEIKTLIDNLQFLEKALPTAINNWKKQIKTCDWAVGSSVLKKICENPGTLHNEVFVPLYSFLNNYILNREGKLAFTSQGLDSFLLKGLVAIQKYIVLSDFFAKNPSYFVPNVSITQGFEASKVATVNQNKYKDFIFTLNEKLIGCKDNLSFIFLKLVGTVKNMSPELEQTKSYLNDQCASIRIARLRM